MGGGGGGGGGGAFHVRFCKYDVTAIHMELLS